MFKLIWYIANTVSLSCIAALIGFALFAPLYVAFQDGRTIWEVIATVVTASFVISFIGLWITKER